MRALLICYALAHASLNKGVRLLDHSGRVKLILFSLFTELPLWFSWRFNLGIRFVYSFFRIFWYIFKQVMFED